MTATWHGALGWSDWLGEVYQYSDFEGGRAGLCTFLSLLLICGQLTRLVGRTCQAMASVQLGTYIRRGVPLNLGPQAGTSNPDASSIPAK